MILKNIMKRDARKTDKSTPPKNTYTQNDPDYEPPYNQTQDGRLLGPSCVDFVPDGYKNAFPPAFTYASLNRSHDQQEKRKINQLGRQYLPLKYHPDGDVDFDGYKFRMRGLNQTKFNAFLSGVTSGMSRSGAAALAGVDITTLRMWERKAQENIQPYTFLVSVIEEAETHLEKILMEKLIRTATEATEYTETKVEKERTKSGKLITTKKTEQTKTRLPQLGALIWRLERLKDRREYHPPQIQTNTNQSDNRSTDDDLLLAMDVSSTGLTPEQLEQNENNIKVEVKVTGESIKRGVESGGDRNTKETPKEGGEASRPKVDGRAARTKNTPHPPKNSEADEYDCMITPIRTASGIIEEMRKQKRKNRS